MAFEYILTRVEPGSNQLGVGVITLNRPKALNTLCTALMIELGQALQSFESDAAIGCIIITGSEKAFAAGADISEMVKLNFVDVYGGDFITANWETLLTVRKPVIAAVAGFALGGGCELAMMCDFILAADNARFGQPEIKIGILPGAGGTQRLPRLVGKAKAMEMVLTGRLIDAQEAERCGLVSRVVPLAALMEQALGAASTICSFGPLSVRAAKESVNRAFEGTLSDGLKFERRLFHSMFATSDQKEGMQAFLEKRTPKFEGR